MRYIVYILSILISSPLFGTTYYVDGQNENCLEHGGEVDTPFCKIQPAIEEVKAAMQNGECMGAYDANNDILDFSRACTVQVAIGTYTENIIIETDLVLTSDNTATGFTFNPDGEMPTLPVIQPDTLAENYDCIRSTITIRPPSFIVYSNLPAYVIHPHVEINGFQIISGEGSSIYDNLSGQYKDVGGAIFSYLTVPKLKNCKFKLGVLGNVKIIDTGVIESDGDPVDIIYPSGKPPLRWDCAEAPYITSNKEKLEWPLDWEIDFANNDFSIDDKALAKPLIFLNGFVDNTVNLNSCLFNYYNTNDESNGVSEYWVKGREKDGEKVTFNFSGSESNKTPISSDTVYVQPELSSEGCVDNYCKTIHAALRQMIPSPLRTTPKLIQLPNVTFSSDDGFPTIPIINGISIEGTDIRGEKTILDAQENGRIFICQDVQETNVKISNLEIKKGIAPFDGDGGAVLLDNCSPTFENVKIDSSSSNSKGGGLHIINKSKPHLINLDITNNISSDNGGGISCDNFSHPIIESSNISNNISHGSKGAGIYSIGGSTPVIHNDTISYNYVEPLNGSSLLIRGVGLYIEYAESGTGFNIRNIQMSNNKAKRSSTGDIKGAGMYITESKGAIYGGTIDSMGFCDQTLYAENECDRPIEGGGLYLLNSMIDIDDIKFLQNYSWSDGNSIYILGSYSSSFSNIIIRNDALETFEQNGNEIISGKGIYIENSNNLNFQNISISGNSGYGIKSINSHNIMLEYIEITDNNIGILATNSDFIIQNLTMANNKDGGIIGTYDNNTTRGSEFYIVNSIIWNSQIHLSTEDIGSQKMQVSYSNYAASEFGAGDYYEPGEAGIVTSGNSNNITIIWGVESDEGIIENTNLDGDDNITDYDPDFSIDNYSLEYGSPCIDTGTDSFSYYFGQQEVDVVITNFSGEAPDMGKNEFYPADCPELGDMNGDGAWDVLDIVTLANCILAGTCEDLENGCAGDLNNDGIWNILDAVNLINCVLGENCGGRVDDANESKLIIRDNNMYIEGDGFIGGVQMTLTHELDFEIEMTNRALFADYLTVGKETRLIIITPETDELFTCRDEFEILDVIVANSHQEITVDYLVISDYSLSEAYPNPFNPSTNIDFSVPVPSDIMIQVFDLRGRLVETLASGSKIAGKYSLTWRADNFSSGLYLIKMSAFPENNSYTTAFHKTRKLLLIK